MATRGRDGNHLYVNTCHDPDPDTQHGPPQELSPVDVLTRVLANEGGNRSATETIHAEWNDHNSISQLWAEYDTIASTDRATRYASLLDRSGLTATELHAIRKSESFGPLMAALHHAEARGHDLAAIFPKLASGRSLDGAEDVAAVLHHRVDQCVAASGHRQRPSIERIVHLFSPQVGVTDPQVQQALDDRRAQIEQRAHHLAATAVGRRHPWTEKLGPIPDNSAARTRWMRQVATIAAYRDRWNIHNRSILGPPTTSIEHTEQRRIAQHALERALNLHHGETDSGMHAAKPLDRQFEIGPSTSRRPAGPRR
jgi:hypothetical protein